MKLLHGTCFDNLPSIIEHGIDCTRNSPLWQVSGNCNYFWDVTAIKRCHDCDTWKEAYREAKGLAADNAAIACIRAKDCRRIVVEVDLPPDYVELYSSADNSGSYLDESARSFWDIVHRAYITKIWADKEDLSIFRPIWLSGMSKSPISNLTLNRIEAAAIADLDLKNSNSADLLCELVDEMEMVYENKKKLVHSNGLSEKMALPAA